MSSDSRQEVVYAISTAERSVVKIGTTGNLPERLATLQRSSPFRLQVLWQHEGGRELEHHLHTALSERRLHGEWFDFDDTDPIAAITEALALPRLQPVAQQAITPSARPRIQPVRRVAARPQPRTGLPKASVLDVLLAELRAVEDPAEGGARVSEALDFIARELNPRLSFMRQEIAQRLRDSGLTYPEIAEIFDVNPSRVPQILKGGATGRWAKVAREVNAAKGEDATGE